VTAERTPADRPVWSGLGGWLVALLLGLDVVAVTRSTDVPNGSGIAFPAVWLAAVAAMVAVAGLLCARFRPGAPRLRPVEVLALMALAAAVLTDVTMAWQPLRDLGIYLKAGEHFRDGAPVYMQTPLTVQPIDRTGYPFLYPPFTLPLFGALSLLPVVAAQAIWVGVSVGLGLVALRIIGLPRRWLLPALLWPPLFQGLWVGNVAVPALALYAIGPWLGAGLIIGAAFKSYTGLAALWLVVERRWRQIALGVGLLLALVALTVPLTGAGLWSDWLASLGVYRTSQHSLPGLYGFGLPRYMPFALYGGLALAAVAGAFTVRGKASLARLGTATVVASPSLFGHGLLMAGPSILSLRSIWRWLAVGFLSTPDGPSWWLAVAVVVASWAVPPMCEQRGIAAAEARPWPELEAEPGLGDDQVQDASLAEGEGVAVERPDRLDPDRPVA
jgi:hypothetical protein